MSDRKLTDNEIVKGLECCCNDDIADKQNLTECYSCPLVSDMECTYTLRKHTLNLINRLQAENKRLSTLAELGNKRANDYRVMRDRALKAEAENESLKRQLSNSKLHQKETYKKLQDEKTLRLNEDFVKTEAYKEFAERLEAEYTDFDEENEVILPENLNKAINDLLKELVGEDDGKEEK